MDDEQLLIHLQDCFTAGYTMPQFCIYNGIKRPLFVGINESQKNFLWQLHVQFQYDRRLIAEFALLKGKEQFNYSFNSVNIQDLRLKNIDEVLLANYDKIIILSSDNFQNEIVLNLKKLRDKFISQTYTIIPLLHFVQKNPGVKIIPINAPGLRYHKNLNEWEKKCLADFEEHRFATISGIRAEIKKAQTQGRTVFTPYDFLGYTNQEVYTLLKTPERKVNTDGSVSMIDDESLGIHDGKRMTAYQPKKFKNTIYFVGNCVTFGYGVPWNKTMESCLQKLLNEKNFPYRVENIGQFYYKRQEDNFYALNKLEIKQGDIVFFVLLRGSEYEPFLDISAILDRPHNYGEAFPDVAHINENGHRAVADYIFKALVDNNFFKDFNFDYPPAPPPIHRYGIPKENFISPQSFSHNKELDAYKAKLRAKRFQVGAIVMNCNPFTLGHEYLVEYASKKVKKLYVFVVEEDKSEFKFADRFKLVQAGVKKFSNVEVLPSGKFIISQQTFSGYFNKENLQDVAVDSSEDVEIFAREIAPSLGITIRFVGEEPEDAVTRQYNENMRKILPQYNIEFCEIPRRDIGGEVISAKKVREALKIGDFDTIKKLVPKTTLKFLRENFS